MYIYERCRKHMENDPARPYPLTHAKFHMLLFDSFPYKTFIFCRETSLNKLSLLLSSAHGFWHILPSKLGLQFFSHFLNESRNHWPSLEELIRIISNRDLATRFETYPASQALEVEDLKLEVKNDDISQNISPFKSLLLNDMFLPIPRLGKRGLEMEKYARRMY